MTPKVLRALLSVSDASASAKQIAQSLLTDTNVELIKQLSQQINVLEARIAELASAAELPEEEVSDEDRRTVYVNMTARLKDTKLELLLTYDRTYLKLYPKIIRTIIATVLVDRVRALGGQPRDEWLDVIAGGELK